MTINEKYQQERKKGSPIQTHSDMSSVSSNATASPQTDAEPKSSSHRKGWKYCVAILAIIFILAAISCPKEAEHRASVTPVVTSLVEHKLFNFLGEDDTELEEMTEDDHILLNAITDKPVEKIMDNFFMSNHVVYSIGYLTIQNNSRRVSIGLFGHVFVLNALEDCFVSEWGLLHSILNLGNF